MKKVLAMLTAFWMFTTICSACELRVRAAQVSPEQKSLRYILNEDGSWSGLTIDLTKALLDEAGCTYSFHPMPWKRGLADLEDGNIDIMMNMSLTEEREKFAYFIGAMDEEKMILVVQKSSQFSIESLEDFKSIPAKFSYERGAYLGEAFDEKIKTDSEFAGKFDVFSGGDITNYERLALGRMGGFIADQYEVALQLADYPQLTVHPFTINQDWVFWGVSRASVSQETVLKLYQAYVRVKSRHGFEQIVNRYAKLK